MRKPTQRKGAFVRDLALGLLGALLILAAIASGFGLIYLTHTFAAVAA